MTARQPASLRQPLGRKPERLLNREAESSKFCRTWPHENSMNLRNTRIVPPIRPGEHLRELRNRLGVTTREVEEFTRMIAEDRQNEEFYISNAWLTQLENKNCIPSIFKLFSLSVIYRTRFNDLLAVFGIDLNASARYQLALPLQNTHLAADEPPDPKKAITFPVRFDKSFSLEKTSLIARMVEIWGEVPIALIQKLDVRHCQYGYVGLQDYTMYP